MKADRFPFVAAVIERYADADIRPTMIAKFVDMGEAHIFAERLNRINRRPKPYIVRKLNRKA